MMSWHSNGHTVKIQCTNVQHAFRRWPDAQYAQEYLPSFYASLWFHIYAYMCTFFIFCLIGENDMVSRIKGNGKDCLLHILYHTLVFNCNNVQLSNSRGEIFFGGNIVRHCPCSRHWNSLLYDRIVNDMPGNSPLCEKEITIMELEVNIYCVSSTIKLKFVI